MINKNKYTQANQLANEAREIVSQIKQAEKGKRLPKEEFMKLVNARNAITTKAIDMIVEINSVLNKAHKTEEHRLPWKKYKEYDDARRTAREILVLTGYKEHS